MRLLIVFAACASLLGCVFGPAQRTEAPKLTEAQSERVEFVGIYKTGNMPGQPYSEIGAVDAADCFDGKAIDTLKRKTVALRGDAVIEVSCASASVQGCQAARKCTGKAVRWNER